jgi:hypothetical protein
MRHQADGVPSEGSALPRFGHTHQSYRTSRGSQGKNKSTGKPDVGHHFSVRRTSRGPVVDSPQGNTPASQGPVATQSECCDLVSLATRSDHTPKSADALVVQEQKGMLGPCEFQGLCDDWFELGSQVNRLANGRKLGIHPFSQTPARIVQ